MRDYDKMRESLKTGIFGMWRNWAFPLAAIVIATLLGSVTSKPVMPIILFAEVFIIFRLIRRNRKRSSPFCFKIPYIIGVTLLWTGVLMVMFNMMGSIHAVHGWNGQPYNPKMPYFPMLIIGPVLLIVSSWFALSRRKSSFCTDCEARTGKTAERGFMGKIFTQEASYQTWFLVAMSAITVVVQWGYFMLFYININLNNTDRFFFIWIILVIYFLSLIYMAIRYYVLWAYYCEHDPNNANESHGYTRIRFLVICGDKIWLHTPDQTEEIVDAYDLLVDTPVKSTVPFKLSVNVIDAGDYFRTLTGMGPVSIRPLYQSSDLRTVCNIFHFAVFLNDFDEVKKANTTGQWFDLREIQLMHGAKILSPLLEAELDRIHRTVMAWKTYTRDGKRLYAIRHYQPTFRLSDMKNWDVDYNDPIWLFVAMNNEDRRFFKLRKLWRKYVTGLGI